MIRALYPSLAAASLALAGCASVPSPDPALNAANMKVPERFELADDVRTQDRKDLDNLLPSDDPAFAELRQMANAGAPSLAAALARIDQARAQTALAKANRRPRIDADASATENDNGADRFGGTIFASWDPDIFGELRASQRAALIRIDAATADAEAVRQGLAATIAENVIDWRAAIEREQTLQADIAAAEELVSAASVRAKAGVAPGFDAVQAQSLLAQARSQLPSIAEDRARIIGALVTLTAMPARDVLAGLAKTMPTGAVAPPPALAPAEMLRARPDVAAAEARLKAADADVAAAAARRFPKLTLSGTLGLLAFTLGDVFSADAVFGSVGAAIAGPLLDFGRVDAEIDNSKARAKEAFASYRSTVFTALGEAETAYGQVSALRTEVIALKARQALEKDAVDLAGIRYKSGLDDFRTVLNAQRALYIVNSDLVSRTSRYNRARVALWLALGGN